MAISVHRISRLTRVLLTMLLLATACCSNNDSDLYAAIEPIDTQQANGLTLSTASGVERAAPIAPQSVSQELFDDVERFYDDYLGRRANVIDGTQTLDAVNGVTTAAGKAGVAEAQAYNKSLHADERPSAVEELWLFPNVESISQVDDQTIQVRDCTEQQEVNALDQFWIYWITNEVLIDVSSGEMRVDQFTTTHNGFLEIDNPVGCAPLSFQERAEAASAQAWTELAAWAQSTEDRTDANLSRVIGNPLRQRVLDGIQATGSLRIDETREHTRFATNGLDTAAAFGAEGAEGVVVIVNSCHQFPNGRSGTDTASQSSLNDLGAGSEQALQFRVLLDASRENRIDQVVSIDYLAERCAQ